MTRCAITATLLIVLSALLSANRLASGEPSNQAETPHKTGMIEGVVDHALIRSDSAVVYIKDAKGDYPAPAEHAVMDQVKSVFTPKILPVLAGTTVKCPNHDSVQHTVFSPAKSAKAFDLGQIPPGESKEIVFRKPGVVPLLCSLHAEMSAFIVVLPNPHFAKTDQDGKFKIENVPPGKYKLAFWHEKLKAESIDVVIKAGSTTTTTFKDLKKGKYSIDLVK